MLHPLDDLRQRGLIKDCTDILNLEAALNTPQEHKLYIGIDLTAHSLHVGHLVLLMIARNLLRASCNVIILLGSGTTKIGDPWGKNKMRPLLDNATIINNLHNITRSILRILAPEVHLQNEDIKEDAIRWQSADGKLSIMDNDFWLKNLNYIDFLRNFGVYFSVNRMLNTELVRSRINNNLPLSFLELNYMLLQAYDFLYLYQHHQCNIQIGGSDQWNNIIQGVELIRRVGTEKDKVFGLTVPLVTRSDGSKMGKTEAAAVWLCPKALSPTEYFQYFRNVNDEDVANYLKIFTELSMEEIQSCLATGDINQAKIRLALETTTICHGERAAEDAMQLANSLFIKGEVDQKNVFSYQEKNTQLIDIMIDLKMAASRGQAKKLIMNGGLKINGLTVKFSSAATPEIDQDNDTVCVNERTYLDGELIAKISNSCKQQFRDLPDGMCQLSCGKKRHFTIKV